MVDVGNITDKWQLLAAYDPDTGEIKPVNVVHTSGKVERYEYADGDMIYKGVHETLGAATSDANWRIWKYTWDINSDPTLIEGPIVAAWDDRAGLGWE